MATPQLPSPEAFGTQAGILVGKRLKVTRGAALGAADVRCMASYVDAGGAVVFVIVTDVAFVASMGAALAMMPAGAVAEVLRTGKPSPALVENAYEVLNVAAALFNEVAGTSLHVKLDQVRIGPLDASRTTLIAHPASRLDLTVTLPGYTDGRLALLGLATPVAATPRPGPQKHVSTAWMVWPPREAKWTPSL